MKSECAPAFDDTVHGVEVSHDTFLTVKLTLMTLIVDSAIEQAWREDARIPLL